MKTRIKDAAVIDQAHTNDKSVLVFEPKSESADAFRSVATEILNNIAAELVHDASVAAEQGGRV